LAERGSRSGLLCAEAGQGHRIEMRGDSMRKNRGKAYK